jgi:anti-sigma regulatory factor (Ser/Thr protein kinase)
LIENVEHADRPRCALSLEADPKAVPTSRQVLRAVLQGWEVPQLTDDATLIVSELVDNAVKHSSAITLVARPAPDGQVTLEVWDDNASPPVVRDVDFDSLDGRGLIVVEALASSWGWRPADGGKVVWAVV